MTRAIIISAVLVLVLAPVAAHGAPASGPEHGVVNVLAALAVIMIAAKLGGAAAQRLGQPAVLGELVCGVLLGNLVLVGLGWFDPIRHNQTIVILAEIGVIILLFQVGLETNLREMARVGWSSLCVAALGIVVPMFLGWGVGAWFFPDESVYMHIFLGATLTATSVGITARIMRDLGRITSPEARTILGAAVIDDVMGLVILAMVTGIITAANTGQTMSSPAILWLAIKAILFLAAAIVLGRLLYRPMFRVAAYLRGQGVLLIVALLGCFIGAWAAAQAGLAPIVGAFAAGLILDEVYYRDLPGLEQHRLDELLDPIATLLVPVFFVLMGMRVDLTTFARGSVLGFAAVLTIAAILGKQAAALGVLPRGPRTNRWIVGLGMIPRGEVGLIFAGVGLGLTVAGRPVVPTEVYSAVVIMVIVTTLVTPPVLTWAFRRLPTSSSRS